MPNLEDQTHESKPAKPTRLERLKQHIIFLQSHVVYDVKTLTKIVDALLNQLDYERAKRKALQEELIEATQPCQACEERIECARDI